MSRDIWQRDQAPEENPGKKTGCCWNVNAEVGDGKGKVRQDEEWQDSRNGWLSRSIKKGTGTTVALVLIGNDEERRRQRRKKNVGFSDGRLKTQETMEKMYCKRPEEENRIRATKSYVNWRLKTETSELENALNK